MPPFSANKKRQAHREDESALNENRIMNCTCEYKLLSVVQFLYYGIRKDTQEVLRFLL